MKNRITLLSLILFFSCHISAAELISNITIQGEITHTTCIIHPESYDLTISFGDISRTFLRHPNQKLFPKTFHITLENCPILEEKEYVEISFIQPNATTNNLIRLSSENGLSEQDLSIGIGLAHNNKQLEINGSQNLVLSINAGRIHIPLTAYIEVINVPKITAKKIHANATFKIVYH